ncbi:thioredoxin family protein [Thioalkalivibrio denitrificans]|uniref:thioredoxin family protein n=1 Tax=Thioalkalivibrio denitrificans TaxID=108003 RepID=UPI001FE99419|nr:thioredoxin family protein [Thioalkalivibrio denitrificans]
MLALFALAVGARSVDVGADDHVLREVTDLQAKAAEGLPILVEFALTGCPHCHVAEEEFLKPMIRSGEYEGKVLIRKLLMDRGNTVVDFDGQEIAARDLARRYGAVVAPTVVVLSPDGELLTDPVVGLKTVDFYGGYLYRAIDRAVEAMAARDAAEVAMR